MTPERQKRFIELALAQVGKPYSVHYNSSEWVKDKGLVPSPRDLWDFDPKPVQFDCSGLLTWLCGLALKIKVPHGTKAQQDVCEKRDPTLPVDCADLGFIERLTGKRHVVIHLHDGYCIEASGSKGKVVVSEASRWEKDPDFLGWFRLDSGRLERWRKGIHSKN